MNPTALALISKIHPTGKAYTYQLKWARDESRYKLGIKARQIGITTTEAVCVFIKCLMWKESPEEPHPPVVAFCSPSQRQSSRLMEYVQRARSRFEALVGEKLSFRKERDDWLYFDNFAEIWSLPNNPRTIEGLDLSHFVIDEIGNFMGKEDKEIYQAGMASLGAKGGRVTIFGKPRGRRGLFWELANPHGDFSNEYSIHKFPYTVRAKPDPVYAKTVLEHKARMTPVAFAENYMCSFEDESIVIFPWEMLDKQTQPIEQWFLHNFQCVHNTVYFGIDFGKRESKTCVTVIEHSDGKIYYRHKKVLDGPFDIQKEHMAKMVDIFKPTKIYVDKTGMGIPLTDDLERMFSSRIEGIQFSQANKEKIILNLRNILEDGTLILPPDDELKEQLHGIEKELLDSGKARYTGKRSETDWLDDQAWSLALACSSTMDSGFQFTTIDRPRVRLMSDHEKWAKGVYDEDDD